MKTKFIHRNMEDELHRLSKLFKIVVITGPRQSGKTTLCKKVFEKYKYLNLEDIQLREQIAASPKEFLRQYSSGLIIDEAQTLPEIFSYIQVVADELEHCNFILSGSSNFSLMERVTQSLAGRAASLTLLPLSLSELNESDKKNTNALIINGGYPAVWSQNISPQDVCRQYYNTYIERDVRALLKVKDMNKFQIFIRLCAGRIGSVFNATTLSNEIGVSVHTINEWTSVLEASYILFRVQPYYKNIGKRLIKTPKIYFCDTGLASFLLGIETEQQLNSHPLRGMLFENLVILDFLKNRFNKGKLSNLYYYRDQSQMEVDLLLDTPEGFQGIEVKSSKSFHKDYFKNLDYLNKHLKQDLISTTVIYDGETELSTNKNGIINFRNISFLI